MRAKIDVFRSFFTAEMLKFRGGGSDLGAEAKGRGPPAGRVPAEGRRGRQSGTATAKD